MKKIFFFAATLFSITAAAQSVQVRYTSGSYSENPTVRFAVSWTAASRGDKNNEAYDSKAWVLIDYKDVETGTWNRATIATLPTATTGTPSFDGANRRGFWFDGGSGDVSSTITVTLSVPVSKFSWCAYVSDYPPNVSRYNNDYLFRGTPPFILSNGTTQQTVTVRTLPVSSMTVTAPTTLTDATDCPGIIYTCPYTGSDLFVDTAHVCRQRITGAKNWQAWIRDSRDSELYRIVRMPDNKWWLAQNVKLARYNNVTVGIELDCTKDECGRAYTCTEIQAARGGTSGSSGNVQGICPNGWLLPLKGTCQTMYNAISSTAATVANALRSYNGPCTPVNDTYGWASIVGFCDGRIRDTYCHSWYTNDDGREDGLSIDWDGGRGCGRRSVADVGECGSNRGVVRCYRTL